MRCVNCGADSEGKGNFCLHCGVDSPATGVFVQKKLLCDTCNLSFFETHLQKSGSRNLCEECFSRESSKRQSDAEIKAVQKKKYRESSRANQRSQRNATRFYVAECYIRLCKKGLAARLTGTNKPRMGPLVDLSRTGLQCVAAGTFVKGDIAEIELLIPAFSTSLQLQGTVCWAVSETEDSTRVGVVFDPADIRTQKHLEALERYPTLREAAYLVDKKRVVSSVEKTTPQRGAADF